ncbi:MAG: NTP transferase domain-containing protein [Candidatus Rokubacteria bacterium]|nr:NTP transferase domain-containing protein [Candidatus Rokubacteria bacterium]
MQIVIPMSGAGARFVRAGYRTLKPLVEVDGRPMIEHVAGMFPGAHEFLFICAETHLAETPLRAVLERIAPSGQIVGIAPHQRGPVHAALEAAAFIEDDAPVVLSYCDFGAEWDFGAFERRMAELQCAGCVTAYRGFHPHSLGPTLYAYIRERDGRLLEIQEKRAFTDDRMREYASAGTYYFRTGALLKHYFRQAVARGLATNGEFYASMPYNLMVADGLDVRVYELARFLQWGTPEDLEEYQAWSRYFRHSATWRPRGPATEGTTLVPMAGAGVRFQRAGYTRPKPLVPVDGVPMIERARGSFPRTTRAVAVGQATHLAGGAIRAALRDVELVTVPGLTAGQASTCLAARDRIDPDTPLLIAPCDAGVVYDEARWARLIADPGIDAVVWTFRNHPHANRSPRQYGWVRTTRDGDVAGVSCKTPISEDPRRDPGVIGAFWFRRARFFLEAADALIAAGRRVNGEFYVDSVVDVLCEQGRRARVFDVDHYLSFGTPDDVRTYEYWAGYFRDRARVDSRSATGFPGRSERWGGVGGHFGAPHDE